MAYVATTGKILIVDDNAINLEFLQEVLYGEGYTVLIANNGHAALDILHQQIPDLILLDIMMPVMDGYEVARRIKQSEKYNHIPIIFISAMTESESLVEAFTIGAVDYIFRPFNIMEVLLRVKNHLSIAMLQRKLSHQNHLLQTEIYHRINAEEALKQANATLEERIEQRTAELRLANIHLKVEILEREAIEKERDFQRQQLIQSDKLASLGEVVAGVAHEINNPNSLISYNVPVIKQLWQMCFPVLTEYATLHPHWPRKHYGFFDLSQHMQEMLEAIEMGSDRISKIVSKLKDYARLEESSHKTPVQLNQAIENTLLIVGSYIRKLAKNIDVDMAHDLPQIQGHLQKIEQIITNLVINAAQALTSIEQGHIRIQSRYLEWIQAVMIRVEDNGVGIDPMVVERIFEPFFSTKRGKGGTGLGLSVSYGLIQEHHGIILIHSKPCKGTCFDVLFPIQPYSYSQFSSLKPTILCIHHQSCAFTSFESKLPKLNHVSTEIFKTHEMVFSFLEVHPEIDMVLIEIANQNAWQLINDIQYRFQLLTCIGYVSDISHLNVLEMINDSSEVLLVHPLEALINQIHKVNRIHVWFPKKEHRDNSEVCH
ncbi:MAG: response regulator [Desulfobacterales bacterium]|nr:response regulator [Desulfobacterales bacterium]